MKKHWFADVLRDLDIGLKMFWGVVLCYKLDFLVDFDKKLDFQGFERFFGGLVVIFDGLKSGEMLDFVGVCRSGYRSKNGEKCEGSGTYGKCMGRVSGTHDHDFKNRNNS